MKNSTKQLLILVVCIAIVGYLVWRKTSTKQSEQAPETTPPSLSEQNAPVASITPVDPVTPAIVAASPVAEETAVVEPEAVAPDAKPAVVEAANANAIVFRGESFPVKPAVVLATVNNVEISLKDLIPIIPTSPEERTMSAADFKKQLQRAIDREVIFETARRQNFQLDEEQRRVVEKARLSAGAKGFSLPDTERPGYEAKSNFESLELLGTLMGEGLAKASGGPAKDAVSEEEYQKYIRGMLDELKKQNNVSVNAVVE